MSATTWAVRYFSAARSRAGKSSMMAAYFSTEAEAVEFAQGKTRYGSPAVAELLRPLSTEQLKAVAQ